MNGLFPVNLVLAFAWAAVTGEFSLLNLVFGFILAFLGLWLIRNQIGTQSYVDRGWRVLTLAVVFVWELIKSALRVAWIVIQPKMTLRPGIIAYPLKVDRDFEITLLANLMTLTPGTLSVDVSIDRRFLYIHAVDVPDPAELKRDIAMSFERLILEAFR